jgi:hypothetical protein
LDKCRFNPGRIDIGSAVQFPGLFACRFGGGCPATEEIDGEEGNKEMARVHDS